MVFDPSVVTYEAVSRSTTGTTSIRSPLHRQFCDIRRPVSPGDLRARRRAARCRGGLEGARCSSGSAIRSSSAITPTPRAFYHAEDYHQDYYKKNSAQYRFIAMAAAATPSSRLGWRLKWNEALMAAVPGGHARTSKRPVIRGQIHLFAGTSFPEYAHHVDKIDAVRPAVSPIVGGTWRCGTRRLG